MAITSECTFQDFDLLLGEQVVSDLSCITRSNECEFMLPVFAYPTDTTDLRRNDFKGALFTGTNRYTNPEFFLEVQNNCGWTEVATLDDNTYGTLSTFTSNPFWLEYKLQWHLVESLQGVGLYRIRLEYTDVTDSVVKTEFSYKYNLKIYSDDLADKTSKLTYTVNGGKTGDKDDDSKVIDYKSVVWEREFRLPSSFFGFPSSEFTREFTRFKTGAEVWTRDEQVETYIFNARKLPSSLHKELKIVALQADEIYISDYNKGNPEVFNRKRVIANSEYTPTWVQYVSYAPIELEFKQYFQNLQRKRC